jgi:thioester reductase-like protein
VLTLVGTRNLIDLVRGSPHSSSHFDFCSSIASVTGISGASGEILEEPSTDPLTASPIGYSQSKWVVERICQAATETSDMSGRVHVLRIGQLCGDTKTGYWNEKEGWPLLIRTGQTTSCLPSLEEVGVDQVTRRYRY